MKMTKGVAALAGVLLLVCAFVAWEWYSQVGRGAGTVHPVQQIAAAPSAAPTASPTPGPVVYVPKRAQAAASPSPVPSSPRAVSNAALSPPPAPQASASPQPAATATPYAASGNAVSNEPMVAATLGPHAIAAAPVREPADAPPRILSMSISTPVARNGQVVSGTVETTSNVASVEARIAGYSSSMQKIGVGKFALSYRVPNLPFFLHRTYTIEVIARNTRGDAVTSSLPITIR